MSRIYPQRRRHRRRSLRRRVAGWIVVGLGLAFLPLPGPGMLVLALGVILVGRRDPTLRRMALSVRLGVRRLSRAENRAIRFVGGWLREHVRQARRFIREHAHRHATGQPLSPGLRLWIGVTIAVAIASAGISIYMILA